MGMKKIKIIKVYIIPDVKEYKEGGRDDLSEQAEAQLNEVEHFQYMQIEEVKE